ncbi:MAG: hypothetical protein ACC656_08595, partial [Candidatus Heimdallarchaeota archaeon]
KSKKKPKKPKLKAIRQIKVSLYRSKKGKEKKEFLSKSDQYDQDMNVIGEFKESGEDNGIICVRISMLEERIVIKAFNDRMIYLGTLEEAPTMSYLIRSTGKSIDYPHLKLLLPNYEYVVELRKVYGGFLKPEKYSFYLHFELKKQEQEKTFNEFFSISQKRMAIGDDWYVRDAADGIIAKIDGRKTAIGADWNIEFYPTRSNLHLNNQYVTVLLLFTAFRRYEKDVMKRLSKNYENYRKKNEPLFANWHEMTLYKNPRMKN